MYWGLSPERIFVLCFCFLFGSKINLTWSRRNSCDFILLHIYFEVVLGHSKSVSIVESLWLIHISLFWTKTCFLLQSTFKAETFCLIVLTALSKEVYFFKFQHVLDQYCVILKVLIDYTCLTVSNTITFYLIYISKKDCVVWKILFVQFYFNIRLKWAVTFYYSNIHFVVILGCLESTFSRGNFLINPTRLNVSNELRFMF